MKTIAEQLGVTDFPFLIKDKQGNEIYYEIDGYWSKKEYDSENRELYCEDSSGFWWRREFDSDGNIRYFQNSRGEIEDNRPKPDTTHGEDWDDIRAMLDNEDWDELAYGSAGKKVYHINSDAETKPDEIITLNGIKYKRIDE